MPMTKTTRDILGTSGASITSTAEHIPGKYIDIWMKYSYVFKPIQPKIGIHVKDVHGGY